MRCIVRKDTKQNYQDLLTDLAKASGIDTPTREDLVKRDIYPSRFRMSRPSALTLTLTLRLRLEEIARKGIVAE